MPDRNTVERARTDVDTFARELIGEPLWPHQRAVATSPARIRSMCSGRQAGKSRTLAVCALHDAYAQSERRVLILSAGEDAARDLLGEISALATAPLLAGSVVDDTASLVTLTNGSTIRSVPASVKQVRGKAVDLLIVDEACWVDEEVWQAARYTVIARPGSRVIMCSTPWGRRDRFFAVHYRAGERGTEGYASFHWPSTASPLVDEELLGMWRATSTEREFRAEVLAEWVDEAGAYFSAAELEAAVVDYELIPPEDAHDRAAVGGVDWGFAADANALVLLAEARAGDLPDDRTDRTFFVPFLEECYGMPYSQFIDRVCEAAAPGRYRLTKLVSETNGVGSMPSQELEHRRRSARIGTVVQLHTDARSKEESFGTIRVLLQQGRLALPRHPSLLAQLSALEFEQRDSGTTHISVPERLGHDDLAMALSFAVTGQGNVASMRSAARSYGKQVAAARVPGVHERFLPPVAGRW